MHDAEEVYFLLGLNGATNPPRAIGRIRMSPTAFGGVAQEILLPPRVSWPVTQWPDIAWGQAVVLGTAAARRGHGKKTADAAA